MDLPVPGQYGVDLAGRKTRSGLPREQQQAHDRMSSLPKTIHHRREIVRERPVTGAAKAGHKGPGIELPGSLGLDSQIKADIERAKRARAGIKHGPKPAPARDRA